MVDGLSRKTLLFMGYFGFPSGSPGSKVGFANSGDEIGMSRLELTQKRLTQALESLEKAAELAAQRGKATRPPRKPRSRL